MKCGTVFDKKYLVPWSTWREMIIWGALRHLSIDEGLKLLEEHFDLYYCDAGVYMHLRVES